MTRILGAAVVLVLGLLRADRRFSRRTRFGVDVVDVTGARARKAVRATG